MQTLRIDKLRPGLYHVTGRNEAQPELSPNALGKSSLFKAIFWGCFGEDDEGIRGPALKNWSGAQVCAVIIDAATTAGALGIFRTQSPNRLEAATAGDIARPIDQAQLTQKLGIDAAAFLHSQYFAQYAPAFIDLKPGEQAQLFTSILQLGVWEEAAKRASATASAEEQRLQSAREALARLRGEADALLELSYEADERQWDEAHQLALKTAQQAVTARQDPLAAARKAEQAAKKDAAVLTELYQQQQTATKELGAAEHAHTQQSRRVVALQRDDISKCPECGAPVTRKHVKDELGKALALLKQTDSALTAAKTADARIASDIAARAMLSEALRQAQTDRSVAEVQWQGACAELQRVQAESNPYTVLREQQDKRGAELVALLAGAAAQVEVCERAVAAAQFWSSRGFKEIRLNEVRQSIDQLTLECNETLFQLGLHDWEITFDVERETQAGTISRGFATMIKAPDLSEPVPFKAYSGGEKQRLRLATTMGMANLINSRQGVSSNVEFWDEPTHGLNPLGVGPLLAALSERARRYQRVILLADHRSFEYGDFAGTITLVKDSNGTRIEPIQPSS